MDNVMGHTSTTRAVACTESRSGAAAALACDTWGTEVARGGVPTHRPALAVVRDDSGATTAEYAVCTGAGVGFAAVLFKFLTSEAGQALIAAIFNAIKGLLPF